MTVEITGTFVREWTFAKNPGRRPSWDKAYSKRGNGIIEIIVHPKKNEKWKIKLKKIKNGTVSDLTSKSR